MDDQKEFIQVLAAVMGVKSQEQFESGIKALGEDGLKTMYETYKQVKNLGEEGLKQLKTTYSKIMETKNTTYAKLGAKLNYIKQLRGECHEGYEIEKYLAGGCVACRKKMKEGASVVERFKSEKCGGKMKKKVTKASGGSKVTEKSYMDNKRSVVPAGEKPDSLERAQNKNAEAKGKLKKCGGKMKKVKKNYFGGILDKWL